MNNLRFQGNWNEIKGKLKERFGVLTDNDLAYKEGQEEQLLGNLQQKLGKSKDEIKKIIREL
ncbi:MAG: CsbD family protein [Balneolaceae bacterium]|nr:CsbD family protein [Balneolaceae bacterium]